MALGTARFQQIDRNAASIVYCGTCMVQRAQRVREARYSLVVSLVAGGAAFSVLHRGLPLGWRYGYLVIWAAGAATLTVYFVERIC